MTIIEEMGRAFPVSESWCVSMVDAGGYGADDRLPKGDQLFFGVGAFVGVVRVEELLDVGDGAGEWLEEAQFVSERTPCF